MIKESEKKQSIIEIIESIGSEMANGDKNVEKNERKTVRVGRIHPLVFDKPKQITLSDIKKVIKILEDVANRN